jgi:hypothetical protein
MALRSKILTHALPLIPTHSFTPSTLTYSLSSLSKSHPDYQDGPVSDSIIDTLFGGDVGAKKALLQAWEQDGLRSMTGTNALASGSGSVSGPSSTSSDNGPQETSSNMSDNPTIGAPSGYAPPNETTASDGYRLRQMLASRLDYSSRVGEHLVEAYALLSSPASTPSVPLPTKTLSFLSSLTPRIPPLYSPPGSTEKYRDAYTNEDYASPSTTGADRPLESSASLASQSLLDRLPLLRVNPIGPLAYAWQIADEALYTLEKSRKVQKGMMNEPVGTGVSEKPVLRLILEEGRGGGGDTSAHSGKTDI